jgi:hypothetical protein
MGLDRRNKYPPQMIEYDMIGDMWVPDLMKCSTLNIDFHSVSTDKRGLRKTIGSNGNPVVLENLDKESLIK